MTPFKYKVGQRVELLADQSVHPRYHRFFGAITTIVKLHRKSNGKNYYVMNIRSPLGGLLRVAEPYVRPIDDPPEQVGSWETITKLLGTDIRKELIRV